MQISITNGTLTQVQETLSPASGYELPATVTVTGASFAYNDGTLILTNPTSSMSITASAAVPLPLVSSFSDLSVTEYVNYIELSIENVSVDVSVIAFFDEYLQVAIYPGYRMLYINKNIWNSGHTEDIETDCQVQWYKDSVAMPDATYIYLTNNSSRLNPGAYFVRVTLPNGQVLQSLTTFVPEEQN